MNRLWNVVALAVIGAACATEPNAYGPLGTPSDSLTLEMRVPGCFVLENGVWQSDEEITRLYPQRRIPRQIRFDTTLLADWPEPQDPARPLLQVVTESVGPFKYWQRENTANRVFVGYPGALAGVSLSLHPVLEGLAGDLTAFTDAVEVGRRSTAKVPVLLRTIGCD